MTEIKSPALVCPPTAIVNEMIECEVTIPHGTDMTATIDFGDGSNVLTTSVAGKGYSRRVLVFVNIDVH